jgi:RHS repeat-associated protein
LQALAGATGTKASTASGNADVGNTHILALRPVNTAPTVSLSSPAQGATFTAPATITLTATVADTDGTIQKVEFFHGGTNLIATVTTAPYTFDWTNVAAGSYTLTAKATDNQNGTTTSAPVNVTVNAGVAQMYFIHTDHLDTPRLITNGTGQAVWRREQSDPFGGNPPDENPSGLGAFTYNLRLPGQYFDKETNTHYNYFRDYDPAIGRYLQSDPIGLDGGINTYAYVDGNPLSLVDPLGQVPVGSIPEDPNQPAIFYNLPRRMPQQECPTDDCPNPITITNTSRGVCREGDTLCGQAMKAAGLAPPYFPQTMTSTYSGTCLLKFGVGFTGAKFVAGTALVNQAPNIAARAGFSAANVARVATAASALNSPPAMVVGGSLAIVGVLKKCECPSK